MTTNGNLSARAVSQSLEARAAYQNQVIEQTAQWRPANESEPFETGIGICPEFFFDFKKSLSEWLRSGDRILVCK